jgi:hypothetical protein
MGNLINDLKFLLHFCLIIFPVSCGVFWSVESYFDDSDACSGNTNVAIIVTVTNLLVSLLVIEQIRILYSSTHQFVKVLSILEIQFEEGCYNFPCMIFIIFGILNVIGNIVDAYSCPTWRQLLSDIFTTTNTIMIVLICLRLNITDVTKMNIDLNQWKIQILILLSYTAGLFIFDVCQYQTYTSDSKANITWASSPLTMSGTFRFRTFEFLYMKFKQPSDMVLGATKFYDEARKTLLNKNSNGDDVSIKNDELEN